MGDDAAAGDAAEDRSEAFGARRQERRMGE
jgi:hypothetical protein